LLLNKLFPIVDACLSCEDIARQICGMVPRVQHISDLHSKFALGPLTGIHVTASGHWICSYRSRTLLVKVSFTTDELTVV